MQPTDSACGSATIPAASFGFRSEGSCRATLRHPLQCCRRLHPPTDSGPERLKHVAEDSDECSGGRDDLTAQLIDGNPQTGEWYTELPSPSAS